jgi:hypothetical protein
MFVVEYRTVSKQDGITYPINFLNVGSHKAQSVAGAEEFARARLGGNVEIVCVRFVGSL